MTRARLPLSLATACLFFCAPAWAQVDEAEVLEIVRSLAPRAGQTEAPRYVAEGVRFEFDSDRLTAAAREKLDRLARALRSAALAGLRFRVEGHTDSRGSAAYNRGLSERRGRSVAAYLARIGGVASVRLEVVGYGEDRPRDPLNPENGVNRRVEILTLAPPPAPSRAPPRTAGSDDSSDSFVEDVLTGSER